jgi:hypothetical protein
MYKMLKMTAERHAREYRFGFMQFKLGTRCRWLLAPAALFWEKDTRHPWNRKLSDPQTHSERCVEEKSHLTGPEIESRFFGRPSSCVGTTTNVLFLLGNT